MVLHGGTRFDVRQSVHAPSTVNAILDNCMDHLPFWICSRLHFGPTIHAVHSILYRQAHLAVVPEWEEEECQDDKEDGRRDREEIEQEEEG